MNACLPHNTFKFFNTISLIFNLTDEALSTLGDGTPYWLNVAQSCRNKTGNYTSTDDCIKYGGTGVGFLIQYNFSALHAAPLFQALADQALVREALNDTDFSIQCTIEPLPLTAEEESFKESEDTFMVWFLLVFSFPFISGAFAVFVVAERESKAKHLQTIAGVKPSAYWLSTYAWDIMNYQIPLWITVMLTFAFDVKALTTSDRDVLPGMITLLFLYGPAAASFAYVISHAFSSPSMCNMFIIISGFLVGMGKFKTVLLLLFNERISMNVFLTFK
jgi:ATP-binding cassette, subfamily A (ABC1), member 3